MDIDFAVRYPFSSKAREILQEMDIQLNESYVEFGLTRIQKALEDSWGKSTAMHQEERVEEIIGYASAKFILGCLSNRFVTNKFAVAEAKRAIQYFHQESKEGVEKLGGELDCPAQVTEDGYWMNVPVYVHFAPGAPPYKLINRRLQRGRVLVNRHERLRLLEEAVRLHVGQTKSVFNPPPMVKKAIEQLKKSIPQMEKHTLVLKSGDYPPCIQELLEDLKRHENLPHHARWYLAVYLLHTGMPEEQLINLYSNLPDFNEKITRYQIMHAQKKRYTIPTCSTIKSWGINCPNCRRKSPLQWSRKRIEKNEGE